MRFPLCAAAAAAAPAVVAALAAPTSADQPALDYPAVYDVRERVSLTASVEGHGTVASERRAGTDVLVFDDEWNLHFEPIDGAPELHGTWKWTRHRRAAFFLDVAAVEWMQQYLQDEVGRRITLFVRPGKLTFRRDHRSFTAVQILRATAWYLGNRISIRERVRYVGPRATSQRRAPRSRVAGRSAV